MSMKMKIRNSSPGAKIAEPLALIYKLSLNFDFPIDREHSQVYQIRKR